MASIAANEPHEVVGTFGEVRGNYDGESRDHFHRGLDIQTNQEKVVAIQKRKSLHQQATSALLVSMKVSAFTRCLTSHMKVGRDAKDRNRC